MDRQPGMNKRKTLFPVVEPATPLAEYPSEKLMRKIEATPLPRNIWALLEEKAAAHPEKPLLHMFDDELTLSYGQFRDSAAALASSLAGLGVSRGTNVGLLVDTSATFPLSWAALGLLGAVTVPINYGYTSRELDYVLRNADCFYLIIDAKYLSLYEALAEPPVPPGRVIVAGGTPANGMSAWQDLLVRGDASFSPQERPEPDDLVNIQFTSGTTGFPKGAMLTHRGLLTHGRVGAAQLLDTPTRFLIAQPFHYITAQWQLLSTIFQGGTAFMPRRQSATRFFDWVKTYRIEFCNFPEIVALAPETSGDIDNDLQVLYCYSHRLENYRDYERRYGCLARQGFSMTETALALYVPVEADHMTGTGTVGIPVAFREIKICDPAGAEVPHGQVGEICVRGPGMLAGYYKNPEATQASFHEGGWFRTGDQGRRNAEGWVWYLGRSKDMIKRSGENISAVEVEAILRGVEGIAEVALVPVPDPVRGEEGKVYILLQEGRSSEEIPPARIAEYCARHLAKFKIPRYFEYVSEFPRTPGGKIKKAELRAAKADLRVGSFDLREGRWH